MEYTPTSPHELDLTGLDREEVVITRKAPGRKVKQTPQLAKQRRRYHEKKREMAEFMAEQAVAAAAAAAVAASQVNEFDKCQEDWLSPSQLVSKHPLRLELENDQLFLPFPFYDPIDPTESRTCVVIHERPAPPEKIIYAQREYPIPGFPGCYTLI